MAGAGRQHRDVAGLDVELLAVLAAEAHARLAGRDAEHLVDLRVVVHERVDAVAPHAVAPAVLVERLLDRRRGIARTRQPPHRVVAAAARAGSFRARAHARRWCRGRGRSGRPADRRRSPAGPASPRCADGRCRPAAPRRRRPRPPVPRRSCRRSARAPCPPRCRAPRGSASDSARTGRCRCATCRWPQSFSAKRLLDRRREIASRRSRRGRPGTAGDCSAPCRRRRSGTRAVRRSA